MAAYIDLFSATNNSDLNNRLTVAVAVSAEVVRNENPATANHANRLLWAKSAFDNPEAVRRQMIWSLIAQNAGVPDVNDIYTATDTQLRDAVLAAVDIFATG